ncbi:MAG: ABC transporter ATP-binding protein [Ruminococcaceae bacterium]|nr:ABC transporter ATP-binding protein [Oscillospiraceae bacterium]
MSKYKEHIKKYWYCFILGPLFMMLEACGEFILPYINANIIDVGAANKDTEYILINSFYMVLIAIFMLITGVLGAFFSIRASTRLAAGVRKDCFYKIQSFSFRDIDRFSTGSLITRITNDMTQIQNFAQTLLRGMFRSPIMLIGAIIMSFSINTSLAWIIMLIVPLLAISIALIIVIASPRYTQMQKKLDALNNNVSETVTNHKVIKSFVREEYEIKKFSSVNSDLYHRTVSALKMMLLLQPISAVAINVSTLLVVWFAGKQIMIGGMEIGDLTAFITYLSQILTALNFVASIVLQGTRAAASDKRISEVLNTVPEISDENAKCKDIEIERGSIEFRKVSFRYFKNNSEKILEDISLKIKGGSLVGIIGSTGSGKTTLISMIPRLYDPDEGEVLIDGVNVKDMSLVKLRDSVSVVLQKNTLFSGTIAENLRWGNETATYEELEHAASLASADSFIKAFPNGYDTEIGQGGAGLSGGQKQRICIARALLKKPKILILDDSTSAVDTATDAYIRQAFRQELPNTTKIVIAQRINSVMDADIIIVMDGGKIAGIGIHSELMNHCEPYREIYWSQKDKEEL